MKWKVWLLLGFSAVLLSGGAAQADFYVVAAPAGVGTRITILPYTISAPGFYYLGSSLTTTGSAIVVNADNVTIDLMGFSLAGPGGAGDFHGIDISGRNNVEIRNGTIRNFPGDGIRAIVAGMKNRIINMRLEDNGVRGIHLLSGYHLIENCTITNNGNHGISIFANEGCMVTGNVVCGNGGSGIYCTGKGHSLLNNVVVNNTGFGFNLSFAWADAVYLIDRNTAFNNTGGTLNGIPPSAKFGVNAGTGFP